MRGKKAASWIIGRPKRCGMRRKVLLLNRAEQAVDEPQEGEGGQDEGKRKGNAGSKLPF